MSKDLVKIKADVLLLNDDAMKDHAERCSHDHDSNGSVQNLTPLSTNFNSLRVTPIIRGNNQSKETNHTTLHAHSHAQSSVNDIDIFRRI